RCGQQARLEVPIAPYAQTYSPGSKDGLDPGCLTAFSERWSIAGIVSTTCVTNNAVTNNIWCPS
ncbi:MAG: hypothetical protein ACI9W4_002260, partial [Rhodothermales bacterium]